MRTRMKLVLAGAIAAVTLGAALNTASANRFRISNNTIRSTWSSVSVTVAESTVRCPLTLEGSFHSTTFSKVVGSLVGYITRASITSSACTGGHATVLAATLPWHIVYHSFEGTLPNISHTEFWLIGGGISAEAAGVTCLARSEASNGIEFLWKFVFPFITIRLLAPLTGGFPCELSQGRIEGESGTLTTLGTTTRITITLI